MGGTWWVSPPTRWRIGPYRGTIKKMFSPSIINKTFKKNFIEKFHIYLLRENWSNSKLLIFISIDHKRKILIQSVKNWGLIIIDQYIFFSYLSSFIFTYLILVSRQVLVINCGGQKHVPQLWKEKKKIVLVKWVGI